MRLMVDWNGMEESAKGKEDSLYLVRDGHTITADKLAWLADSSVRRGSTESFASGFMNNFK